MVVRSAGSEYPTGHPRLRQPRETPAPDAAAGRFLVSLHVLARARRLYRKDHPKIEESLDAAERSLRAALGPAGPLAISLERGQFLLRGRPLRDTHGELKALSEDLLRRGINALAFRSETHAGELLAFVELFESTPARSGAEESPAWNDWLARRHIAGIRVNEPVTETRADALLPRILATVIEQRLNLAAAGRTGAAAQPTQEVDLLAALRLLDSLIRILPAGAGASSDGAREAAREFERSLSGADPSAIRLVAGAMDRHPPRAGTGETLEFYFARLAEEMVLAYSVAEYRAGRLRASRLREHAVEIGCHVAEIESAHPVVLGSLAEWAQESRAAEFELIFWSELTPKEVAEALRSSEAWAVPPAVLRAQLEQADTTGGLREARAALLAYARCLLSPDSSARMATAAGLSDLCEALARFWPEQLPEEFGKIIFQALVAERLPTVAALLVAVVEGLASAALSKGRYAEYEGVFQAIEQAPRDAKQDHLRLVERRLFEGERWEALVRGAIERRPLDPSLVRLLARDPERLLDRLAAQLTPSGAESPSSVLQVLPAMVRLVRAIGEPAITALAARAFDQRLGRATAAVKLLAAVRPQRLMEVLPQAIPNWDWSLQDLAISELARQNVPRLSLALLGALPRAHLYVVPMILDQVGIEGELAGVPALLEITAGQNDRLRDVFIRIKAIEALGRLRAPEAALILRTILRQRNGLTYVEPAGLRAAAEEALEIIEGRLTAARLRAEAEGTTSINQAFVRARRYPRFPLESPLQARIEGQQPATARVRTIGLGGACLQSGRRLQVGDSFPVGIKSGLRTIHSMAVVRSVLPEGNGVEFVHMNSEDREKLRRLLRRLSKD